MRMRMPTTSPPSSQHTPHTSRNQLAHPLTPNMNQNDGSMTPIFANKLGVAHSLTILRLGFGASETKIKVHYQKISRKFHPNKNDPAITGLTAIEASDFSKLLNNVQACLKEHM